MAYDNLVVYYFSGTGNAKNTAYWIAETARDNGLKVFIYNIDRFFSIEVPETRGKTLFGFIYPTHGFNAPPLVLKFLLRFPRKKTRDVFLINTRAGMKLHKWFLPGLSGFAQVLPNHILWSKGYRIKGYRPVDLPSNWISLHPGIKGKVVDSIYDHWHGVIKKFSEKILSGKWVLRGLIDLPIDILLMPIAVMYFFIGRFALAKTFVATSRCKKCKLCINQCPVNAIRLKYGRPYWKFTCESCMRCMNNCPEAAIETAHGFSFIVWYISIAFVISLLLKYMNMGIEQSFLVAFKETFYYKAIILFIIKWSGILFPVFLAYEFLHLLMGWRPFNAAVTWTSLTKFGFWRKYKAPKKYKKVDTVNITVKELKKG